jgi:hypothetical protein
MRVHEMRKVIKKEYPNSGTWPLKVDKMTDQQVIAIFLNMQRKQNQRSEKK